MFSAFPVYSDVSVNVTIKVKHVRNTTHTYLELKKHHTLIFTNASIEHLVQLRCNCECIKKVFSINKFNWIEQSI